MTATPDVLAFADRRVDGAFTVTEPSGGIVASIRASRWTGMSFEAVDSEGQPLCSGRRRGWLSGWWDAVDAVGAPLASLKNNWSGRRRAVVLPDGVTATLEGQWFGRDWVLRTEAGADLLTSVPANSSWSFSPDAWIVRSHDVSLTLAQVVGIVETNRLMVKAARSSASAAGG